VSAQAQGALTLCEGDAGAALGPLRVAFELWNRLEAPYEAARVRVLIGQACRALGDHEASALESDAARATFTELGAEPDLARVNAREGAASTPAGPLTARELEVLRLIAAGHTNKTIADALYVSERTIDRHVSNILTKLEVRSRAAATAYAYTHQLL
jgi:DNA-binding NarL/FixJ family response regulator